MTAIITDPSLEELLKAQRHLTGTDRYDEVWEGTYMMAPMPNDEHQQIVSLMTAILVDVVRWPGLGEVRPGVNVTDQDKDWTQNCRVPDVAVFLNDGSARNCGTHWFGGPDFVIEIISPGDQVREKLPFYEKVAVRELLLIDRDPWSLELYRLEEGTFAKVGNATFEQPSLLASNVVWLTFRLIAGSPRPQIEVTQADGGKQWLVGATRRSLPRMSFRGNRTGQRQASVAHPPPCPTPIRRAAEKNLPVATVARRWNAVRSTVWRP